MSKTQTNEQRLPQYLINAERFMQANLEREITLTDIAQASGCSERAIVNIFQEYRETHPMTVLARLRSLIQ